MSSNAIEFVPKNECDLVDDLHVFKICNILNEKKDTLLLEQLLTPFLCSKNDILDSVYTIHKNNSFEVCCLHRDDVMDIEEMRNTSVELPISY